MERAFDTIAIDEALGERGEFMGADVVGGVEAAVDLVDGDVIIADLHGLRFVLQNLAGFRHAMPVGGYGVVHH